MNRIGAWDNNDKSVKERLGKSKGYAGLGMQFEAND